MTTLDKPLVVITGGSGLIGSRLRRQLSDRYCVVILDVVEPENSTDSAVWIKCDLTDDSSVRDALAKVREYGDEVSSVIHLAAYYDFAGEASPLYDQLTVQGTRRLLEALQEFRQVEQFIFSSSLLVMQPCEPGEQLNELSPTRAEWEYPESKLAAEQVIRKHRGSIPSVFLRMAGVYDEEGHSIPITQNIRRIAEKEFESYFYPGDSERGQSFVHLEDLVRCVELAVEKRDELAGCEVLLVAESECLSYEQLQDQIGELVHGVDDWPTIRIPKFVAKAGAWVKEQMADTEEEEPFIKPWMVDMADAHYDVDNHRARTVLGWDPQHRLSNTLPEMIQRLKQDPRRWYVSNGLPLPDDDIKLKELTALATH